MFGQRQRTCVFVSVSKFGRRVTLRDEIKKRTDTEFTQFSKENRIKAPNRLREGKLKCNKHGSSKQQTSQTFFPLPKNRGRQLCGILVVQNSNHWWEKEREFPVHKYNKLVRYFRRGTAAAPASKPQAILVTLCALLLLLLVCLQIIIYLFRFISRTQSGTLAAFGIRSSSSIGGGSI